MGMRKGVVVDLDETIKSIEAATERAERMAGVHFSEVFVGITGDHIRSTNNRAVVAVIERRPRSEPWRRPPRHRRQQDHQSSQRPADHPRLAALLYGRRPGRRERPGGHGRWTARGRYPHRHRQVRASSPTCSSASSGPDSSPWAWSSSRWRAPPPRSCQKRSRSASCCSTSAAERPISRSTRWAAPFIPRRFRSAATCSRATFRLGLKTTLAEAEDVKKRFGRAVRETARALPYARLTAARPRSTRRPSCGRSSFRAFWKRCAWLNRRSSKTCRAI